MLKELFPVSLRHSKNPFFVIQNALDDAAKDFYGLMRSSDEADFEDLNLSPSLDVVEDGQSVKFEFELPGLGPDDLKVSIDNGYLNVTGEKHISKKIKIKIIFDVKLVMVIISVLYLCLTM